MEKEVQPDSMTTVTIKPEYPPSEIYSSEPPPAYPRTQSSSVQVAKIIAVTVVLMSFILGTFILASAYVTATASCRQLEQELEILNEAADKFQPLSSPEALVQNEQKPAEKEKDAQEDKKEARNKINSIESNSLEDTSNEESQNDRSEESNENIPIHIKLPLQLNFDDLAGALLEKNERSRMNCVVEKKRAEEIVDQKPKILNLPFGINVTTNPRFQRLSGERMAIFCESGNMQNHEPFDEDQDEEAVVIQPIMIPISQTHLPTSNVRVQPPQQQAQPMESIRGPISMVEEQNQLPPSHILDHIVQQIITKKIMDAQRMNKEQNQNIQSNSLNEQDTPLTEENIPIPMEVLSQLNSLPNRDVIVTVTKQEYNEPQQLFRRMPNGQQLRDIPVEMKIVPRQMNLIPPEMRPLPQQSSNFPDQISIGTFVQESTPLKQPEDAPERVATAYQESQQMPNNKESYVRLLPVDMDIQTNQQEQNGPQPMLPGDSRPHYVHPRSVRSVDEITKMHKRVKRCSCDCAC